MGALANIVHNIRRGSSSPPSGRPGRSLITETDLPLCCAWVWGGLERIAFFTPTTASSRWRLRRCWTGTVATTARRMVATSEGGGRPCRQSRLLRWWHLHSQYTTETDRFQYSISDRSCCPWRWFAQARASQRFLAPRPIGETPVGECPGRRQRRRRHTVATGRWRCFFSGWGTAGGGDGGVAPALDGHGLKISYI